MRKTHQALIKHIEEHIIIVIMLDEMLDGDKMCVVCSYVRKFASMNVDIIYVYVYIDIQYNATIIIIIVIMQWYKKKVYIMKMA